MKKFDESGLKLCKVQGNIFVKSITATDCSSPIFIRRFMYSAVASRMDKEGFLYEACDVMDVLREVEDEFGVTDYGKDKYAGEELYWMGYMYRYWCYVYEKSSKQVYKIIKPKELRGLYYPYHSLDPAQAIERILEAKQMGEEEYIQKGVEILRRLMKNS